MRKIVSANYPRGKNSKLWWLGLVSPRQRGETSTAAKLTEADVLEIRARAKELEPKSSIAKDFPVSEHMIGRIVRRQAWAHVPEPQDG